MFWGLNVKRVCLTAAVFFSLGFLSEAGADGIDITANVLESGKNRSGMAFWAEDDPAVLRFFSQNGLVRVDSLIRRPAGAATYRTGEVSQISDRSGFSFNIPTDSGDSALQGVVRAEGSFALTRYNIGSATFDKLVSDMRARPDEFVRENGRTYFVPANRNFIERYGLEITALFTNGERKDVTRHFDYRILMDDLDDGSATITFGGLYADAAPSGSALWREFELEDGVRRTLFYDGRRDGDINAAFWLSKGTSLVTGDDSSGGCNAGIPAAAAALPLCLLLRAASKKWKAS